MNVENHLEDLMAECMALKSAFMRSARQLPVFTKKISFTTSQNSMTVTDGGNPYSFNGAERVVVTLNTSTGSNTLATLEINVDSGTISDIKVRRVPYSGGARWIVYNLENYGSSGEWKTTVYDFSVQTAVDGALEAKMIWQ